MNSGHLMYTTTIIFGAFYFIFSENDYVIGQKPLQS